MPTQTEAQIGIEPITQDPFTGEDQSWISQDKYESTTPAHWQTLPVSYFRREGVNSITVEDVAEDSIFKPLIGGQAATDSTTQTIHGVGIHLRSDGLFVWSPTQRRGVIVPVACIATYAPVKLQLALPTARDGRQVSLLDPAPVLRLDLIPDSDAMDMAEDGFAPSLLVHLAFAPDAALSETAMAASGPEGIEDTEKPASTGPPCMGWDDVADQPPATIASSMDAVLQSFLAALQRCQEQLPDDQADSEDDDGGGGLDRRVRLPAIHAGSGGMPGIDGDAGGGDVVRIAGLENFGGWVTADNVDEVMRMQGMDVNGHEAGQEGHDLGPGAGSRRQREDVDGDGDGDGERVTIWQRTDAA